MISRISCPSRVWWRYSSGTTAVAVSRLFLAGRPGCPGCIGKRGNWNKNHEAIDLNKPPVIRLWLSKLGLISGLGAEIIFLEACEGHYLLFHRNSVVGRWLSSSEVCIPRSNRL